jgi:uncharacterized membrane protein YvbJ
MGNSSIAQCPKCGYERHSNETECPRCGIIYDKWKVLASEEQAKKKVVSQRWDFIVKPLKEPYVGALCGAFIGALVGFFFLSFIISFIPGA